MKIERDKKLLSILVNKQFEIKNIDYSIEKIWEDGEIVITGKKKKEWWYNHYKFDNEEEYILWRNWVREEIEKKQIYEIEKETNYVDMRYGMIFKY